MCAQRHVQTSRCLYFKIHGISKYGLLSCDQTVISFYKQDFPPFPQLDLSSHHSSKYKSCQMSSLFLLEKFSVPFLAALLITRRRDSLKNSWPLLTMGGEPRHLRQAGTQMPALGLSTPDFFHFFLNRLLSLGSAPAEGYSFAVTQSALASLLCARGADVHPRKCRQERGEREMLDPVAQIPVPPQSCYCMRVHRRSKNEVASPRRLLQTDKDRFPLPCQLPMAPG